MTSIGAQTGYSACTQESLSVTVDATTNRINSTGFGYDSSGNMTGDGFNTYAWNAESELKSAASVNYTYDGDGNRVQKSNGKIYWYGAGSEVLDESDATGNITDEYVYFGGKRVAHRKASGEIDYYIADHLGTSRVVTNATGGILDDSDFYPFGGDRSIVSSSGNNYKFTGKERDSETGLDNFLARYFGSSMGRFMSPDPLGGHSGDPQTLNKYVYVRDNPLRFTDPTGLDLKKQCSGESASCHKEHWWSHHRYEGTYDDNHHFNVTHFQTDQNGNIAGHNINFNSSGVHIDGSQGEYISGTAQTRVNGDPNSGFAGTHFEVNSNCLGTCLAGGALYSDNGSSSVFKGVVASLEGPNTGLDALGSHPGKQYRGGNEDGPDAHLSFITDATGNPAGLQPFHIDGRNPFHSGGGFLEHTGSLIEYDFKADILRQQGPPLPPDTGNNP